MSHSVAVTESSPVLADECTCRSILVLEVPRRANRSEQEVVRQELQPVDVRVLLQLVNLDTGIVIDVNIFLLRRREEAAVVQPFDIPHRLPHLNLTTQLSRLPNATPPPSSVPPTVAPTPNSPASNVCSSITPKLPRLRLRRKGLRRRGGRDRWQRRLPRMRGRRRRSRRRIE